MITASDMMIDGDTAMKTKVLYVTGCHLVTLRGLGTLQIVVIIMRRLLMQYLQRL
jgi:hypothetical protein